MGIFLSNAFYDQFLNVKWNKKLQQIPKPIAKLLRYCMIGKKQKICNQFPLSIKKAKIFEMYDLNNLLERDSVTEKLKI